MLSADLYLNRIEIVPYLAPEDCQGVPGVENCAELAARLQAGALGPEDCPNLDSRKRYPLSLALNAREILPAVPSLDLPRPMPPDLFEINEPDRYSPVLVTGNSEFTLTVLTGVLATTISPFYLLSVDCRGDTVDMSMILRSFTPQRLDQGLLAHNLADRLNHRSLILPGWLGPLREEMAAYTGWKIRLGPISAGELPLFLWKHWLAPPGLAL